MNQINQQGSINILLIPLIFTVVALLAMTGFAFWAFTERQDYKENTDEKIESAVTIAVEEAETAKDNEFIEREKEPLKDYRSPSQFGSVFIKYPKTWSAYIDESGRGNTPLQGYFYPSFVPSTNSGRSYALRVELINRSFSQTVRSYDNFVRSGRLTSNPYQPKNVDDVVGLRLQGEISSGQQGIVILLPVRNQTLLLATESNEFYGDFENHILENLVFEP